MADRETVIPTICHNDCGGGCLLKIHVRQGAVTRVETDDGEGLQYRACPKGRAHRQRMYSPDRLKYPMRRVGERGAGKFERISWDEALNTVAGKLPGIKAAHGPAAILRLEGGGDLVQLHSGKPMHKLLCSLGGYSATWGIASFEGARFAGLATYGTAAVGNTRDDLPNSKLIIMWGLDVASTIHGNNTRYFMESNGQFAAYGQSVKMLNAWKQPGDITDIPKEDFANYFDTRLLEDASFMRLKNLTISYTIPQKWAETTRVFKSFRVYAQGQNLVTWTRYLGFDPEYNAAYELGQYPHVKTITFGIDAGF